MYIYICVCIYSTWSAGRCRQVGLGGACCAVNERHTQWTSEKDQTYPKRHVGTFQKVVGSKRAADA